MMLHSLPINRAEQVKPHPSKQLGENIQFTLITLGVSMYQGNTAMDKALQRTPKNSTYLFLKTGNKEELLKDK